MDLKRVRLLRITEAIVTRRHKIARAGMRWRKFETILVSKPSKGACAGASFWWTS
jgi:hypothetical protein